MDTTSVGCDASQDESGRSSSSRSSTWKRRATVYDRGEVDIDVHLLDDSMLPTGCIDRDHRTLVAELAPGTYHFALDTFVGSTGEQVGEYLFVLVEDNGAR